MNIYVFTTTHLSYLNEKSYLFQHQYCDVKPAGALLQYYWQKLSLQDKKENLFEVLRAKTNEELWKFYTERVEEIHPVYESSDTIDDEDRNVLIELSAEQAEFSVSDIIEFLSTDIPKLWQIKGTNIFAIKSPHTYNVHFLSNLWKSVSEKVPEFEEAERIYFIIHGRDIGHAGKNNHMLTDTEKQSLLEKEGMADISEKTDIFAFSHTVGDIVRLLGQFDWSKFSDETVVKSDAIHEYIKNLLDRIPFKKETFNLLERYAQDLYLSNKADFESLKEKLMGIKKKYNAEESKELKDIYTANSITKHQFRSLTDNWLKSLDNPVY